MITGPAERAVQDITVPMLVVAGAFVLSLLGTTVELVRDQQALAAAATVQARGMQDGDRIRQQLERLLTGATDIAHGGDAPVQAVLDALAKQGVVYNAPAGSPTSTAEQK